MPYQGSVVVVRPGKKYVDELARASPSRPRTKRCSVPGSFVPSVNSQMPSLRVLSLIPETVRCPVPGSVICSKKKQMPNPHLYFDIKKLIRRIISSKTQQMLINRQMTHGTLFVDLRRDQKIPSMGSYINLLKACFPQRLSKRHHVYERQPAQDSFSLETH